MREKLSYRRNREAFGRDTETVIIAHNLLQPTSVVDGNAIIGWFAIFASSEPVRPRKPRNPAHLPSHFGTASVMSLRVSCAALRLPIEC
jgi:hypothetical protein